MESEFQRSFSSRVNRRGERSTQNQHAKGNLKCLDLIYCIFVQFDLSVMLFGLSLKNKILLLGFWMSCINIFCCTIDKIDIV